MALPIRNPRSAIRNPSQRILLIAGEASGDVHGADLVSALRRKAPQLEIYGVGGPALRAAGMHTLVDTAEIAGMGLFEARDKIWALIRAYRQLTKILRTTPPSLLILIDFPEFNLRVAKVAKRAKVPVFYYISPQVWAWRKRRVYTIAQRVDQLAVVFPFESAFYTAHGCHAEFVGHPLVERVRPSRSREETLQLYSLNPRRKTIALLPGSRAQEVRYLLGPLLGAAALLGSRYQFVLAVALTLQVDDLKRQTEQSSVQVVQGDTYNLIHAADLALVASGTATLETALLERPMVIVYRMSRLTYALARLFVRVPFIGMPNLIAEQRVVPELLQGEVTPERIASEAEQLLNNPHLYNMTQAGLREVRRRLGGGGAVEKTADLVLQVLQKENRNSSRNQ